MLEASNAALRHAVRANGTAYLVVPSHEWAQQRKLQLSRVLPTGISALTHSQLVEQLWSQYGSGARLVTAEERKVLLRPLIEQAKLLDFHPSPKLVAQLAAFVEEAMLCSSPEHDPARAFTGSESRIMEIVSLYERKLELEGLVEVAQAESLLLQTGACNGMSFVFERPDLHSAHTRSWMAQLEHEAQVTVIEPRLAPGSCVETPMNELDELRNLLYTGRGGLQARGMVRVGESYGAHASDKLFVELVQELHDQAGVSYGDMLACMADPSEAHPRLHEALARAGIPFSSRFSIPCARIGLGAAFFHIEQLSKEADDGVLFSALVDVASSPYAGIAYEDARALQMRWRERAHSTHEERMKDILDGFAQGNASSSVVQERLVPLRELLEATRAERVSLMFEHAKAAHLGVDALVDDKAAAEALLDHLSICEGFSAIPDADEMASLPVQLARSFGDQEEALLISSSRQLVPARWGAVMLCDLDAARYPMAAQSGPFDELMEKLGIERSDTLAQDQRIMLLDVIESCETAFAFTRSTHAPNGDESCQSALFEELVSAYRTPVEDEAQLPIQAVPSALQRWALSTSEAEAFFTSREATSDAETIRGHLGDSTSLAELMLDARGEPLSFSPTALEDYYRCPYRWFACRRVGYNGMDARFDPASQGNLVHAVLERFYRAFIAAGYERVTPDNLDHALEMAGQAFSSQVEEDRARDRKGLHLRTRLDECVCEELRDQVLDLIRRDACFLPGFAPSHLELSLGHDTGMTLEYAGVPVRGKVDRVDVDAQGNAIVIDYKLSALSAGYGFGKGDVLPQRIQTDIYATLVQRHFEALGAPVRVIGSVYRSYSKNMLRGAYAQGIDWGPAERVRADLDALPHGAGAEAYEGYLRRVEDEVFSCMERMRAGDIAPSPIASDVCEHCKAQAFCPVGGA